MKKLSLVIVFSLIFGILIVSCGSYGPDRQLGFQAVLTNASGLAVPDGNYEVIVKFYYGASPSTSATPFYTDTQTVAVKNGMMNIAIPNTVNEADILDPGLFARPVWVEFVVDGETMAPRQKLLGAPYAFSLVGGSAIVLDPGQTISESPEERGALTIVNRNNIDTGTWSPGGTGLVVSVSDEVDSMLIRGCAKEDSTACSDAELVFRLTGWGNIWIDGSLHTGGADFAEMILLEGQAEPGDVLVVSPNLDRAVVKSSKANDTAVAGVYSINPGIVGGSGAVEEQLNVQGEASLFDSAGIMKSQNGYIPVGITGIVQVKVTAANGPIHRGDMLTTSDLPGFAMLATEPTFGAILGKAMGELLEGEGVIDVMLLLK